MKPNDQQHSSKEIISGNQTDIHLETEGPIKQDVKERQTESKLQENISLQFRGNPKKQHRLNICDVHLSLVKRVGVFYSLPFDHSVAGSTRTTKVTHK